MAFYLPPERGKYNTKRRRAFLAARVNRMHNLSTLFDNCFTFTSRGRFRAKTNGLETTPFSFLSTSGGHSMRTVFTPLPGLSFPWLEPLPLPLRKPLMGVLWQSKNSSINLSIIFSLRLIISPASLHCNTLLHRGNNF